MTSLHERVEFLQLALKRYPTELSGLQYAVDTILTLPSSNQEEQCEVISKLIFRVLGSHAFDHISVAPAPPPRRRPDPAYTIPTNFLLSLLAIYVILFVYVMLE
jgi:hypothetical protein